MPATDDAEVGREVTSHSQVGEEIVFEVLVFGHDGDARKATQKEWAEAKEIRLVRGAWPELFGLTRPRPNASSSHLG
jgi:hypothetical protein